MLRALAQRGLRRAMAVVCALIVIVSIRAVLVRELRVARAETISATFLAGRRERTPPESAPVLNEGARAPSLRRAKPVGAPHPANRSSHLDRDFAGHGVSLPESAPPEPPRLPASRQLLFTAAGNRVFAYPPLEAPAGGAPAPLVMMLHGMCGDARLACDFWSDAAREGGWLVCPAGNARCGPYDDWKGTGEEKAAALDEALAAVDRAFGPALVTHDGGDVLIGFSRGAFVARDVAYARPGRFRGLVLLGAAMTPDAARLRASGVRRVVLAAGEYDGARPTMQRAARALDAAGLSARYVGLGRIGHQLPHDLGDILREAIAWIREAGPGS